MATDSNFHRSPMKRRPQKYRSINEIMEATKYDNVVCVECGFGDRDEQILLCDKCDGGYHMVCLRPIVVRPPIGPWYCPKCTDHPPHIKNLNSIEIPEAFMVMNPRSSAMVSPHDSRKRKRRISTLVHHKKSRRLLPYIPSKDADQRLQQIQSLTSALISLNLEFSNDLTYPPDMAPKSANKANLENGGMQVGLWPKVLLDRDMETYNKCRAMAKRGEYPPLRIVYDNCQGYTVEADGHIKGMTLLAEYTGDVDYIKNRQLDDSDSMMTLLLATDPDQSLVICPDKRGNIGRFISGINNHIRESRKKINVKCVRYDINGECRTLLVVTRDIAKGERLYYDYNGYEHAYPTHYFI